MAKLLKSSGDSIKEGDIFNRWLYNRLIRQNKNVLSVITGGTGSSKSYQDLRRAELWYQYHFKEEFPEKNICFSVGEIMKRLTSKDIRKGEVLIFEEAGVNLGSLDFQNKIVKLFNYVLQSFRSMNVAIFFNLPYLGMLSKQARILIHIHFVTCGIDPGKKIAKSKAYFRQVNQQTGKVYPKYLRIRHNDKVKTIKKFNYLIPNPRLVHSYEAKKERFIGEMNEEFSQMLDKAEYEQQKKMDRESLTEKQMQVYELLQEGYNQVQIGEMLGKSQQAIASSVKFIRNKGYKIHKNEKPLEKQQIQLSTPIPNPS